MGVFSTIKNNALSVARFILPKQLEERFGIVKETPFQIKIGQGVSPGQANKAERITVGQSPIIQKAKQEAVKNVEPQVRTKVIQEIQKNTPEALRLEVKDSIIRDLNSGVLERTDIKRNVKNLIEQRVNERILQIAIGKPPIWTLDEVKKDPIAYSKAVLDKDWKRNAEEIVDGIGVLIGMGLRRVKNVVVHPIETFKNDINITQQLITSPAYRQKVYNSYIKPIVEEYKEYRHPFQKLAEDPT